MDEAVADEILERHWQSVVNSVKAGAVDGHLDDVIEAERRRDPPRDVVLDVLKRRRAAVDGVIDTDNDTGNSNG